MQGKTVLITGANQGIGKASAIALGKLGAKLVLVCRNADKARSAKEESAVTVLACEVIFRGAPSFSGSLRQGGVFDFRHPPNKPPNIPGCWVASYLLLAARRRNHAINWFRI